jgi:uncharacterized membrane protein YeaQ/YmgE (transglycosylase-associated protein family)
MSLEDTKMHMSNESLLIILGVGLIAGWLAGQIVQGTGFGIVGDLIIGIVGAFIGSWLLPQLGIHLGSGIIAAIINATIGALILLLIIRLVRGGGGWRGSWRRRWYPSACDLIDGDHASASTIACRQAQIRGAAAAPANPIARVF